MAMDDASIREALRDESDDFRKLEEMHGELDSKLMALSSRSEVKPEDEIEEKRLKKMKLKLKDKMYGMMREYSASLNNASAKS